MTADRKEDYMMEAKVSRVRERKPMPLPLKRKKRPQSKEYRVLEKLEKAKEFFSSFRGASVMEKGFIPW